MAMHRAAVNLAKVVRQSSPKGVLPTKPRNQMPELLSQELEVMFSPNLMCKEMGKDQ